MQEYKITLEQAQAILYNLGELYVQRKHSGPINNIEAIIQSLQLITVPEMSKGDPNTEQTHEHDNKNKRNN